MCKFSQPFLIADIVSYFKGTGVGEVRAYIAAGGMVLLTGVYSVLSTQGEYLGQIVIPHLATRGPGVIYIHQLLSPVADIVRGLLCLGTIQSLVGKGLSWMGACAGQWMGQALSEKKIIILKWLHWHILQWSTFERWSDSIPILHCNVNSFCGSWCIFGCEEEDLIACQGCIM